MSFRINPYKIIRLVGLIAVLSYGFVEISEFRNKKIQETGKVEKKLNIRKKDFYNSPEEKEKILVFGNSGIGKSTLAKILTGFYKPLSGMIRFHNNDITKFR